MLLVSRVHVGTILLARLQGSRLRAKPPSGPSVGPALDRLLMHPHFREDEAPLLDNICVRIYIYIYAHIHMHKSLYIYIDICIQ